MKKQNIVLLVISFLFISLNGYSQNICPGLIENDICEPGIKYEMDSSGNLVIATYAVEEGHFFFRLYVRMGNEPLKLLSEGNKYITAVKFAGEDILYSFDTLNSSGVKSSEIRILRKDPTGEYIDNELFEILTDGIPDRTTATYSDLIYRDGYAYVKKTSIYSKYCPDTPDGMPDFNCLMNSIVQTITYLRANVESGLINPVSSIPSQINNTQYSITFTDNDIYRLDTLSSEPGFKLWIDDFTHGGQYAGAFILGDVFYYSVLNTDSTTSFFAVDMKDDIAKPKEILTSSILGFISVFDYDEGSLKIQIGQTNLEKRNGGFGTFIATGKKAAIQIENSKVGDIVKVYLKKSESESEIILTKTISNEDISKDGIPNIFFTLDTSSTISSSTIFPKLYSIYVQIGDRKSNEESVKIESIPKQRVLVVKLKSPYPDCYISTQKGIQTTCYTNASLDVLNSVMQKQIQFAPKVMPVEDLGGLEFVGPIEIEGTSFSSILQTTYLQDYEKISLKMLEQNCQRAVVIADHSYADFWDHQIFLNPSLKALGGVASGKLAFVFTTYEHMVAHELSHTFGIYHPNDEHDEDNDGDFIEPKTGYLQNKISGINPTLNANDPEYILPDIALDYMWARPEINRDTGQIIDIVWTQSRTYEQGAEAMKAGAEPLSLAPQFMIAVTGYLGSDNTIEKVKTRIVSTSVIDKNIVDGKFKIITVNKDNNQINSVGFNVNFEYSGFIDDPNSTIAPISLSKVPIIILIPFSEDVTNILVEREGQLIAKFPPLEKKLNLIDALASIPDIGLKKNSLKSREELKKIILHIDNAKRKSNFHEILAQLLVLRKKSDLLIKEEYPLNLNQITKASFDALIEDEINKVKELLK